MIYRIVQHSRRWCQIGLTFLLVACSMAMAAALSSAFAASEAPVPKSANVQLDYKLGAGDKIRVTVFGQPDLSGDFEIDGQGGLSLPLIQRVNAIGLTIPQLEDAITNKLKPNYLKNPRVNIEVLNYRPFYILGEVQNPGSYAYVNGMTIVTAVAIAGGFTYRAKKDSFELTRAQDPEKTKKDVDATTPVLPGDVIEVRQRIF
jgi:protein involved in polysaccharide export with SLBB domain